MKLSRLVGRRSKETPHEATSVSHQFLLRGAYARPVASGIYSILPLGKKVLAKIESIIRDEMNAINGQEVLMPIVMPRELWEESGRYHSIDQSLLRFKDRNQKDFVLGMTHEEAVLALARTEISSYKQLPFMLYQIQTKFRDEARPRGGLIRVREFTMKDAYSFHRSQEDLANYYDACYKAYQSIFDRVGLKNVRIVRSDTGMMGGAVAHEFMLEAEIGEDSLVLCDSCGYSANCEVATSKSVQSDLPVNALTEVHTPSCKTIEQLCKFLGVKPDQTAKAVFFASTENKIQKLIFCLIRGDKNINEIKLSKALGTSKYGMASEELIRSVGAEPGYASPINLTDAGAVLILVDHSVLNQRNLVTGANKPDTHYLNFNVSRDLKLSFESVDIVSVNEGEKCIECDKPLRLCRGIEVGNIFQLGTKYSASMKMTYLDEAGKAQTPIMGCYGIGVGRLMASVIEDCHDKRGPIWPWSIAPFHIHICMLDANDAAISKRAEEIYGELTQQDFDVLWDDSNNQAGVQFADADLIGAPIRLIISPRNEAKGIVEFIARDGSVKAEIKVADVVNTCLRFREEAEFKSIKQGSR